MPTLAQAGLRAAMRTIAVALSSQNASCGDALCAETRFLLETLGVEPAWPNCRDVQLEHIQAWLLLAHYEVLRGREYQATLTGGRAFRLVLLSRLYDLDGVAAPPSSADLSADCSQRLEDSVAETEEKRRTFWLAFCLDRFLSMRHECPLTLQEEVVSPSSLG